MRELRATVLLLFLATPLLFRRRAKTSRDDAFRELFAAIAEVYAAGAELKPEWRAGWEERAASALPPRLAFGNPLAESAARDMRHALALLQRNRWKSRVQPLFDTIDEPAWEAFQHAADGIALTLASVMEQHAERLFADERDWIADAIEQFDYATSLRRRGAADADHSRAVAEGAYHVLQIATQLSERLIDRLRREANPDAE